MREDTVTTKVYKFDELSDNAKQTAIEKLCDCNVDYDWWDSIFEDAARIGLAIEEFDISRGAYVRAGWTEDAEDVARAILENHGESCETHRDATQYQTDRDALVAKWSDGVNTDRIHEDNDWDFDQECDELDAEFLRTILEDYSIILQKESEYLQSEEAIIETIEANEWEFTVDGIMY